MLSVLRFATEKKHNKIQEISQYESTPTYQKGGLTYEVEMSGRQYIASYSSTHAHTITNSNSNNTELEIKAENLLIENLFIEMYLQVFYRFSIISNRLQFIPDSHLIKAIAALKGIDQITIKKYVKVLAGVGCIKLESYF